MAVKNVADFITVKIGGVDRTANVISYTRSTSMCEMGSSFTLIMDSTISKPNIYTSVDITESYGGSSKKAILGYILTATKDSATKSLELNGMDKSTLLYDYFVEEQYSGGGSSVDYWVEFFAGLVGLDVEFTASSGMVVEEETMLGTSSIADIFMMLEKLAAYYIRYDSSEDKLIVTRDLSSEPKLQITNSRTLQFNSSLSTDSTRNVIKVYGGYSYNQLTKEQAQIVATARCEIPELVTDKTGVIANPTIKQQGFAYVLANRVLSVLNSPDDLIVIELEGLFTTIKVGDMVYIDIGKSPTTYEGYNRLTTEEISIGEGGCISTLTCGEKCPRVIAYPGVPAIYLAAKNGGGCGVSFDAGDTWAPINEGLEGAGLEAYSIASNNYNQLMCLTEGGVYNRYGYYGTWSPVTIPSGVFVPEEPGLELASGIAPYHKRVVAEPGNYGRFHILTSTPATPSGLAEIDRWWVLYTKNFGYSWESKQLKIPSGFSIEVAGDGIGYNIGLVEDANWDVIGHDITSGVTNNVNVILSERGIPEPIAPIGDYQKFIYSEVTPPLMGRSTIRFGYIDVDTDDGTISSTSTHTVTASHPSASYNFYDSNNGVVSIPFRRNTGFAFFRNSYIDIGFIEIYRTVDGGMTWESVSDVRSSSEAGYRGGPYNQYSRGTLALYKFGSVELESYTQTYATFLLKTPPMLGLSYSPLYYIANGGFIDTTKYYIDSIRFTNYFSGPGDFGSMFTFLGTSEYANTDLSHNTEVIEDEYTMCLREVVNHGNYLLTNAVNPAYPSTTLYKMYRSYENNEQSYSHMLGTLSASEFDEDQRTAWMSFDIYTDSLGEVIHG